MNTVSKAGQDRQSFRIDNHSPPPPCLPLLPAPLIVLFVAHSPFCQNQLRPLLPQHAPGPHSLLKVIPGQSLLLLLVLVHRQQIKQRPSKFLVKTKVFVPAPGRNVFHRVLQRRSRALMAAKEISSTPKLSLNHSTDSIAFGGHPRLASKRARPWSVMWSLSFKLHGGTESGGC